MCAAGRGASVSRTPVGRSACRADIPTRLAAGYRGRRDAASTNHRAGKHQLRNLKNRCGSPAAGAGGHLLPAEHQLQLQGPRQRGRRPSRTPDALRGLAFGLQLRAQDPVLMTISPTRSTTGPNLHAGVSFRKIASVRGGCSSPHGALAPPRREVFDSPDEFSRQTSSSCASRHARPTEILLRSGIGNAWRFRHVFPLFPFNGDVLLHLYTDEQIYGIVWGEGGRPPLPPVGPCITGVIDLRQHPELGDDGMITKKGRFRRLSSGFCRTDGCAHDRKAPTGPMPRARDQEAVRQVESLAGSHHGAYAAHPRPTPRLRMTAGTGTMRLRPRPPRGGLACAAERAPSSPKRTNPEGRPRCPSTACSFPPPISSRRLDSLIQRAPRFGGASWRTAERGVVNDRARPSRDLGSDVYPELYAVTEP